MIAPRWRARERAQGKYKGTADDGVGLVDDEGRGNRNNRAHAAVDVCGGGPTAVAAMERFRCLRHAKRFCVRHEIDATQIHNRARIHIAPSSTVTIR